MEFARNFIDRAQRRTDKARWPRLLLLLMSLALVVRVAAFVICVAGRDSRALEPDSAGYLALGQHFGAAYLRSDAAYKHATVVRTPIYPLFIAGADQIRAGITTLVMLQILVGVAVVAVTAEFARELAGSFAGVVAGLVVALDPLSILYANQVLTETVFTLAFLVSVFALWRSLAGSWGWAVVAGLALAAATLTRPVALYLLVPAALVAATATRRRVLVAAALIVSFLVPTGAWIVRNKVVADYAGVSTIQENNLLDYRAAGALSHDTGEPLSVARADLRREVQRRLGQQPSIGAEAAADRRVAIKTLEHHPVGAAYITARGAAAILFGTGRGLQQLVVGDHHPALQHLFTVFIFVLEVVLLGGAGVGIVLLIRNRRWRDLATVVLMPAVLLVISAGPEAYSRFRVPLVPFLAVLFGIAVSRGESAVPRTPAREMEPTGQEV